MRKAFKKIAGARRQYGGSYHSAPDGAAAPGASAIMSPDIGPYRENTPLETTEPGFPPAEGTELIISFHVGPTISQASYL